jgi:hypothetical protein
MSGKVGEEPEGLANLEVECSSGGDETVEWLVPNPFAIA